MEHAGVNVWSQADILKTQKVWESLRGAFSLKKDGKVKFVVSR
jgi:hypothetical protein